MWVLGLLILLLVAVVVLIVLVRGGGPASIDLNTFEIETTVMWVFLAGALTLLLTVLGLVLLTRGLKKMRRRRSEMRELRSRAAAAPAPAPVSSPQASEPSHRPAPAATSEPSHRSAPTTAASDPADRKGNADDYFDSAPRDR